jgi:phosphoglucosamine mutase
VRATTGMGAELVQIKVGERYVLEAMRKGGHPIGGEPSGNLIFADHATTGDGGLSAVGLLATGASSGRPLGESIRVVRRLPQALMRVKGADRKRLPHAEDLWAAGRAEEAALGDRGRVLVCAAGTEPIVRVSDEERAQGLAERLAEFGIAELGAE